MCISIDDGTFDYVLSSFEFKVGTDVGINGCFAPFLASRDALLEFGRLVQIRSISDGSEGANCFLWFLPKTSLRETSVLNGLFDLLQYQHQAA